MKKRLLAIQVMAICLFNNAVASGIPTVDVAAIANQVQSMTVEASRWKETLSQYKKEYENMEDQLSTAKDQLATMQGIKNVVGNVKSFQDMIGNIGDMEYWMQNSKDILKNGSSILNGDLKAQFDSLGLSEQCKSDSVEAKNICEGKIIVNVMRDEANKKYTKQLETKINELETIAKSAQKAKDMKEAQDYANQIAAINGAISATQAQIQLNENVAEKLDVESGQLEEERLSKIERDSSGFLGK